jgi:zinc protease
MTMRVGLVAAALLFALAFEARADDEALRAPAPSVPPLKLAPAIRYSLANGLRVVLQEDRRLPRVAVHVAYRVGSADDRPGYAGLAHLVEHLTFRGSRHVAAPGSWALLERLGATEVQGTTGLLQTDYWCVIPAQQLENALWIESDRMGFSLEKIDRTNLDRERSIVSQELRLTYAARARAAHLKRALFPEGHPYRPLSTELADLEHFERRHVQRFMQEYYRPDNATLVVVGDFDAVRATALIKRYFGPVVPARMPIPRRRGPAFELEGFKRLLVVAPGRPERMEFVWVVPRLAPAERKRLAVAIDVLVGRLQRRLVVVEALASMVSGGADGVGSVELATVSVQLSARSDAYRVEQAVGAELERLVRNGAGEIEMAENRARRSAQVIFGLEHIQWRAAALAEDPPVEAADELRELRALDSASVVAAARRHLHVRRRLVAYFKYEEEAPRGGEVVMAEQTP